jgi:hypothetical protein
VTEGPRSSTSVLHKQWAKLENEHHELAIAIDAAQARRADLAPMRERQARLLLEINSLVAEIRDAPATTTEDFIALLDVALEHELDLACDIALYGPADYPMITRLLRVLARKAPGFEFNSLRRWLSSSGQFDQLMGDAMLPESAENDAGPVEPTGFGDSENLRADYSRYRDEKGAAPQSQSG